MRNYSGNIKQYKEKKKGKTSQRLIAFVLAVACIIAVVFSVGFSSAKYTEENGKLVPFVIHDEYTLKFDSNAPIGKTATGTMEDQKIPADTPTKINKNQFEIEGLSFAGWNDNALGTGTTYSDEDLITIESSTVSREKTLYAMWTNSTYTVRFNMNIPQDTEDATYRGYGSMDNQTFELGESKSLSENDFSVVERTLDTEYYLTFTGWNTEPDGSGTHYEDKEVVCDLTSTAGSMVDLYAEWRHGIIIFTKSSKSNGETYSVRGAKDDDYMHFTFKMAEGSHEKVYIPMINLKKGAWYAVTYEFNNSGSTAKNTGCSAGGSKPYTTINTSVLPDILDPDSKNNIYRVAGQFEKIMPDGTDLDPTSDFWGGNSGFVDKFTNYANNSDTFIFRADKETMYWTWDFSGMKDGMTPILTIKALDFREVYIPDDPVTETYIDFVNTSFDNVTMAITTGENMPGGAAGDSSNAGDKGTYIQYADKNSMRFYLHNYYDKYRSSSKNPNYAKVNIPLKGLTVGETYTVNFDITLPDSFRSENYLGYAVTDERVTANDNTWTEANQGIFHTIDRSTAAGTTSQTVSFTATADTMYLYFDMSGMTSADNAWHYMSISNASINKGIIVSYAKNQPESASSEVEGQMAEDGVEKGSSYTVKDSAYTLKGWTFTNWNDQPAGTGNKYKAGDTIANMTQSVVLNAQWKANQYTVNYDANAYNFDTVTKKAVADTNAKITKDSQPVTGDIYQNITYDDKSVIEYSAERTGYTFIGWNTKADGTGTSYSAGDSIDTLDIKDGESITLYAQWGTYKITYKFNDSPDNTDDFVQPYSTSDTVVLVGSSENPPLKTGYTFRKWKVTTGNGNWSSGNEFDAGASLTNKNGNPTLTAQWTANTYTVKFDGNDATGGSTADQNFTYDSAQNLRSNGFSRNGYVFAGWATTPDGEVVYTNNQSVKNLTSENGGTVTLYAKWKNNDSDNYINYALKGGTIDGQSSDIKQYYSMESSFNLLATKPVRKSFTFLGWKVYSGSGNWSTSETPTGSYYQPNKEFAAGSKYGHVYLDAQWSQDKYTIKYYSNYPEYAVQGTSGTMADTTNYVYGSTGLRTNAFTANGYTFKEWNTETDGSGTAYANGSNQVYAGEEKDGAVIKLYAQWTPVTYVLNHYSNGGKWEDGSTGDLYPKMSYDIEHSFTLHKAPTKTGYHFIGWVIYKDNYTTGSWLKYDTSTPDKYLKDQQTFEPGAGYGNLYIDARWEANTYYVKFDGNGATSGSMENQQFTYDAGSKSLTANAYTKDGYTFKCWNTKADGTGTIYNDKAGISNLTTENNAVITLYAQWSAPFTVTFDANAPEGFADRVTGTMNNQTSYTYNSTSLTSNAYKIKNDSEKYYTFKEWNTEPNGSGIAYANNSKLVNCFDGTGTVKLYAQWTPVTYKITYNVNGGTITGATSVEYTAEDEITMPQITKTGYTFQSWKVTGASGNWASNTTYAQGEKIAAGTKYGSPTIQAQWTANTYTVKFDGNGATSGSTADQNFTYDASQYLRSNGFSRTGYNFAGWATTPDGAVVYSNGQSVKNLTSVDKDVVTLYAKWTPIEYTISYNANGGTITGGIASVKYTVEKDVTMPQVTRTGWTFQGWKVTGANGNWTSGETYEQDQIIAAGTKYGSPTLTAQWSQDSYTIHYDSNYPKYANFGTSGEMADTTGYKYNSTYLTSNNFKATGYTFKEWNTEPNGTGTAYANQSTKVLAENGATVTLYAQWTPVEYTVSYIANGGTITGGYTSEKYTVEKDVTMPQITRTGWTFQGWKVTTVNGNWTSGETYAQDQIIAAGTKYGSPTLTAQWTQDKYTIEYYPNDPGSSTVTGKMDKTENYAYNSTSLRANAYSATGYTFKEWNTEPDGTGTSYANQSNKVLAENGATVKLYAQWTPIKYNVAYSANSGSGSMSTQSNILYDQDYTLSKNTFTRTGYKFIGWSKSSGTQSVQYSDEQTVKNLSSSNGATVTLYAQWQLIDYTVVFQKNGTGVTGEMPDQSFKGNEEKALTANAYLRRGYQFNGWLQKKIVDDRLIEVEYADKAKVKNLTLEDGGTVDLEALWVVKYYTATYQANGGTLSGDATKMYSVQENLKLQAAATKEGSYFAGWKVTSGTEEWADKVGQVYAAEYWMGLSAIIGDVTLQAQWSDAPVYDISFNENGGEGKMEDMLVTDDGTTTYTLPENTFTKEGSTFGGWVVSSAAVPTAKWYVGAEFAAGYEFKADELAGNVTLEAKWVPVVKSAPMPYAMNLNSIANNENSGQSWLADAYSLSYEANGGIIAEEPVLSDTALRSAATKEGEYFAGWEVTSVSDVACAWKVGDIFPAGYEIEPDAIKGDITLTARWSQVPVYLVTFDGNDAEGKMVAQIVAEGDTFVLPENTFIKEGQYFAGWEVTSVPNPEDINAKLHIGDIIPAEYQLDPDELTGDITFTARWSKVPVYSIFFGGNEGTGKMIGLVAEEGTKCELPANVFIKEGYTFAGWNTNPDGTGDSYQNQESVTDLGAKYSTDKVVLYAQWLSD